MSSSYRPSDNDSDKSQQPKLIAAGVAVLAVLGIAGYVGYKSFGPPAPAPTDAAGLKNRSVIENLVKKTNGDITKMSPEDQAMLQKMTFGHGAAAYNATKADMGMK